MIIIGPLGKHTHLILEQKKFGRCLALHRRDGGHKRELQRKLQGELEGANPLWKVGPWPPARTMATRLG